MTLIAKRYALLLTPNFDTCTVRKMHVLAPGMWQCLFVQRTGKELITSLKSITTSCRGRACGCNVSRVAVVIYVLPWSFHLAG